MERTEMKSLILTNEFPPNIYGGAGVHVDYLTRELSRLMEVEVRCFGSDGRDLRVNDQSLKATAYGVDASEYGAPRPLHSVFTALERCLDWNSAGIDADVVHLHTWYTHFGGILAKLNYGIPLVLTVHSLEPLRPWKREQLGGGYDFSCWVERTAIEMADAVVAVSADTKADVLRLFNVPEAKVRVIHNGIDLNEFKATDADAVLARYGIDPSRPYMLFVGRITRQKGILHLANAIRHMSKDFQIVLCAGAPDTPEIAAEMRCKVDEAQALHGSVIWVESMVAKQDLIALYSRAAVFCCPSVYEPFGIINLEAMACETAVVASAIGGIPEVVVPEETGILVPLALKHGTFEPQDSEAFEKGLAMGVNRLMSDEALRVRMGSAGRRRAEQHFSWSSIAAKTHQLYSELLQSRKSARTSG
jgi:glycosyltransferase involved in cell wall biosynthesis